MSISYLKLLSSFSVFPLYKWLSEHKILPFSNELESDNLATSFSSSFVNFTEGTFSYWMQNMILVHF
jgi:hypothetical protein